MSHLFDLKINQITGNADILLDGSGLASQSQLRTCSIDNFFKWYRSLPSMLIAEVNDDYELNVECCDVQFCLLNAALSQSPYCRSINYKPARTKYSIEERLGWMIDASKELGVTLPPVPSISLSNTDSDSRKQIDSLPDRYRKVLNTGTAAFNIMVVSNSKEAASCMKRNIVADDVVIIVDNSVQDMSVRIDKCPVFLSNTNDFLTVIKQWIDLNLFIPYIEYGHYLLSNSKKKTSFLCEAKVKMLIRDQPIVKSKIPDQIECGQIVAIELDEFPSSTLSLHISDPSVLVQNGANLRALKTGAVDLSILSETGENLCNQKISVFYVDRVKSIDLHLPDGKNVLEGQSFRVIPTFHPSTAQNTNKAVWTTSSGILQNKGAGVYKAINAGKCTITLTIENVAKSIDINVYPLPKDIGMPSDLKVRVNKTDAAFSASLLPKGSACKSIEIRIKDTNIASWDPQQKKVIPISEGTTELIVSGYDSNGQVIVQKSCRVDSLPEKETITPPFFPTLSILCLILAALTYYSEMFSVCILAGLGMSIAAIFSGSQILKTKNKPYNSIDKIELTLGVIGTFIFGAIAAWAFG